MVDVDPKKAARNLQKHGVTLAEGETVLLDHSAITVADNESDPNEQRFVTLGMSTRGRLLVAVYTYRGEEVRMISARKQPRKRDCNTAMKTEYDFSKGKRGAVVKEPPIEPGKTRITIRLDEDVLERFFQMADKTGVGYQTLINSALREYVEGKNPKLEESLRRIIREELARHDAA